MHILIRISELQSDDVDLWTQSPIYIKSSGEPLKYSWSNGKHNLFVLTYRVLWQKLENENPRKLTCIVRPSIRTRHQLLWSGFRSSRIRVQIRQDQDSRSKNHQDPDPGYGTNILNHISESLEQFFGSKYLNSFMRMRTRESFFRRWIPGWKKFVSPIRDKHSGSGMYLCSS